VGDKPKVGQTIVLADSLSIGDLVYFDPQPDGHLLIRKLLEGQTAGFQGDIYRLEGDPTNGDACFRLYRPGSPGV
jgi:hypothetical protein